MKIEMKWDEAAAVHDSIRNYVEVALSWWSYSLHLKSFIVCASRKSDGKSFQSLDALDLKERLYISVLHKGRESKSPAARVALSAVADLKASSL